MIDFTEFHISLTGLVENVEVWNISYTCNENFIIFQWKEQWSLHRIRLLCVNFTVSFLFYLDKFEFNILKPGLLFSQYNPVFEVALSVDRAGILEYWTGPKTEYKFPRCVLFESKLDTDLFEFAKNKTFPSGLSFSPDGTRFATLSGDRKVVHNLRFRSNNRCDTCCSSSVLIRCKDMMQVAHSLP